MILNPFLVETAFHSIDRIKRNVKVQNVGELIEFFIEYTINHNKIDHKTSTTITVHSKMILKTLNTLKSKINKHSTSLRPSFTAATSSFTKLHYCSHQP